MDASFCQFVISSCPCGICVTDSEGRILYANPTLEQLLGWELGERRGQPLADCLEQAIADPAQRLMWTVALSEALVRGKTTNLSFATELAAQPHDGRARVVSGTTSPWQDDSNCRRGALVVFHSSEPTRDRQQSRDRLLAALAHEFGSPLANLAAATELLGRRLDAGNVDQWRLLEVIQSEATRLERLIGQWLSLSTEGEKVPQSQVRLVALPTLLSRVVETFEIHGTGHRFVVRTPEDLPLVRSDADWIQQILNNLVHNAVQYSPPGTQITLAAEELPDKILFKIRDQGPGVPPEDRAHLFEPFFRGEGVMESTKGRGLGLPIARSLAQQLGGDLWYDEQTPEGACFCFALPRL